MRRFAALCVLLLVCLAGAPARAVQPWVVTGTILAPTVTAQVERTVWESFGPSSNGLVGYVFTLPTWADEGSYELVTTGGLPGNPDAWFYTDDGGDLGSLCSPDSDENGTLLTSTSETGTVCPNSGQTARYVMVMLFSGAGVSFRLTVSP